METACPICSPATAASFRSICLVSGTVKMEKRHLLSSGIIDQGTIVLETAVKSLALDTPMATTAPPSLRAVPRRKQHVALVVLASMTMAVTTLGRGSCAQHRLAGGIALSTLQQAVRLNSSALENATSAHRTPWDTPNTVRLSANFVRQAELAHQVSQASVMASLSTAFNASQASSGTSQTLSTNVETAHLDCTQKVDLADATNAVIPLCLTRGKLAGNLRPAASRAPLGWDHRTGRAARQDVWNVQETRSLRSALVRCALDGPARTILLASTAR
jgi:hypothetical protein